MEEEYYRNRFFLKKKKNIYIERERHTRSTLLYKQKNKISNIIYKDMCVYVRMCVCVHSLFKVISFDFIMMIQN